eukprot:gnl/TRDRNA2_/TRDRNA2_29040_c0_seq1.p1 gnl/TRDRNA2_/TRDRNA2_29040_c0~~gnl/TRDRNA2_/TRDRNA2_29040_c0_seq1.p1  ORF type:complete len:353 (+),score=33.73 gnl/TRDRNA2_/TRDRNA2_29040_c0_seq1:1-1059(+)
MLAVGNAGRICLWLALNGLVLHPFFRHVNVRAFDGWTCSSSEIVAGDTNAPNTTGLRIIVAGFGHTGTTSIHLALEMLGLRTYGTLEYQFYQHEILKRGITAAEFVQPMRSCGVQALILEPFLLDVFPALMASSPDAKVILMTREYDDWVTALRHSEVAGWSSDDLYRYYMNLFACHWMPLGSIWPDTRFGVSYMSASITAAFLSMCIDSHRRARTFDFKLRSGIYGDRDSNRCNRTTYYAHHNEVRRLTPRQKLLQLDVKKHTWADLVKFLTFDSPPSAAVGAHLPRANVMGRGKYSAQVAFFPVQHLALVAILLAAAVTNWLLFRCGIASLRLAWCHWLGGRDRMLQKRD